MLDELKDKLDSVLRRVRGQGIITEKNISESLREVRRVLLEADVNYKVAKTFIEKVKERSLGQDVVKSIKPGQQIVKIINDELIEILGREKVSLNIEGIHPAVIMVCGLQGSGKTTFCSKLGHKYKKKGKKVLMVAADIYRPAAVEQLKILGKSLDIPVFHRDGREPVSISLMSIDAAKTENFDIVILDTAGRLHIDQEMMNELIKIKESIKPHEILYVADSMTGQDAVNSAKTFLEQLNFDGIVLSKLDGDTKGGAALSIKMVTGKPIKFVSVGEKPQDLEEFYPDRMASRILGMGDVVSLVEKASEIVEQEQAEKLEKKLRKLEFSFDDFLDQLQQLKKMGPMDQLLEMVPGFNRSAMKGLKVDDRELVKVEAIIKSMTREERERPKVIDGSRRKRIAKGSGTSVQDVNKLLNQFFQMQKMIKKFSKFSKMMPKMPGFGF